MGRRSLWVLHPFVHSSYHAENSHRFTVGWNFFLYEAILIPFEISALNVVITYWSDKIPLAAICAACIVLYAIINLFAVKWYGEAEFWLSSGKIILIFMLFAFTFITMVCSRF